MSTGERDIGYYLSQIFTRKLVKTELEEGTLPSCSAAEVLERQEPFVKSSAKNWRIHRRRPVAIPLRRGIRPHSPARPMCLGAGEA